MHANKVTHAQTGNRHADSDTHIDRILYIYIYIYIDIYLNKRERERVCVCVCV